MNRQLFITCILLKNVWCWAGNEGLEYSGGITKHHFTQKDTQRILIKRNIPVQCDKQEFLTNEMVWTGNYANEKVPQICKSTFVHTTGHLQPIKLHKDLETYGELETLEFIKQMQTRNDMLLIDSRKEKWYDYMTIPGAINMPFHYFKYRDTHEFDFEHGLKDMGVKILDDEGHYDFTEAKMILVFCNGPWCSQSPKMIHALLKVGYPPKKIKWYRGGMQSWLGAGLTSTKRR
ncbi:rhodanese-like domain-containing protein [Sulfurovum sp. zt1-1]|uniref:Rhodanese-like domain-containing protein n=1 Tax=Sulfurovum zhangzhouensis TaxID=3019067 RepID=A0ABT7QYJ6_9BACT|nr:rhodanese-like domain-containing protein [Sulfurovum zhangzhouensis]MDM5271920.1 rhodanese-like domain-containing protein [Sulfurovum zhangzhouensis]